MMELGLTFGAVGDFISIAVLIKDLAGADLEIARENRPIWEETWEEIVKLMLKYGAQSDRATVRNVIGLFLNNGMWNVRLNGQATNVGGSLEVRIHEALQRVQEGGT